MKKLPLLVFTAILALTGCKSAEDYARNNTATAGWLSANAGQPRINVAGHWYSEDWGAAEFKQQGNRVTGILDDYPVGGVVNGKTLYLAITDEGWTESTAVLSLTHPGALEGFSSETVPFNPMEAEPMQLRRTIP